MTITTDNTQAAALLQARVRELEKQLEAADKMRGAVDFLMSSDYVRAKPQKAIAAYDAVRGK